MPMLNPCHPGEILQENLDAAEISVKEISAHLGCQPRALSRVLQGKSAIWPELANSLEKFGWSTADFWMRLQSNYEAAQGPRRQRAMSLINELREGTDAVETLMPGSEPGWWQGIDLADAADELVEIECKFDVLGREGRALEDGYDQSDVTNKAAAARRSVAALYSVVEYVSGMDYVHADGILGEMVGENVAIDSVDCCRFDEFLEFAIDQVAEDALDSLGAAIDRETAIAEYDKDANIVGSDGLIHLRNSSGTSRRAVAPSVLEGVSAEQWCDEFALDAANELKGVISILDNAEDAKEWMLEDVDRSVFTNDVLVRAVVGVILSHTHITEVYDEFESALYIARDAIDSAQEEFDDPSNDVSRINERIENAASELIRTARNAAARCAALYALQKRLTDNE